MENLLVERIAAESLRQTRLLGYEQVVLAYSPAFETKSIGNLIRYDSTLGRKQEKAIEQLEKLQAQRLARWNELEVDCEPEIEFPDIPENDERSEDHLTGEQTNKLNPEACQPTTASIASEANDCEKAIAMKDEPITSPPVSRMEMGKMAPCGRPANIVWSPARLRREITKRTQIAKLAWLRSKKQERTSAQASGEWERL